MAEASSGMRNSMPPTPQTLRFTQGDMEVLSVIPKPNTKVGSVILRLVFVILSAHHSVILSGAKNPERGSKADR